MGDVMPAYIILVDGVVQGVGFRPFVYRMAYSHNLRGYVKISEMLVWRSL